MTKIVLKLELHDDSDRKKAMKIVSGIAGIESISMDTKDNKLTITGDVDPVTVVSKLRKRSCADIISVGPEKEPEKKKVDPKKEEPNKNNNQGDKKKDAKENVPVPICYCCVAERYYPFYYHHYPPNYCVMGGEEYPNTCVIC